MKKKKMSAWPFVGLLAFCGAVGVLVNTRAQPRLEVVKCPCSPTTEGRKVITYQGGREDHSPCLCEGDLQRAYEHRNFKVDWNSPKATPKWIKESAYKLWGDTGKAWGK